MNVIPYFIIDVVPIILDAYFVIVTFIRSESRLFYDRIYNIVIRFDIFVNDATYRRMSYFLPYMNLFEFISNIAQLFDVIYGKLAINKPEIKCFDNFYIDLYLSDNDLELE